MSLALCWTRLYFFFHYSRDGSVPTTGGGLGLPGFEAVYAVAGLLVVAYLVMRVASGEKAKFIAYVKS